jgi:hypothetical protein
MYAVCCVLSIMLCAADLHAAIHEVVMMIGSAGIALQPVASQSCEAAPQSQLT